MLEKTMRKKLLWVGALLAGPFAGLLVMEMAFAPTATEQNYQRIDAGMRLSDVEALLGQPIGNRVAVVNYLFLCSSIDTLREDYGLEVTDEALSWHDHGGSIIASFRPDGTLSYKRYDPAAEESLLHMGRRWLRL
jgi:hypothetical protein